MPTQDLVHYRSEESAYPVVRGGGSSDNSSSLFLGSGQEDWVTKKRIETKTTKNVEKRVQRQDGFAQRKEERFVDYYRVPRNKPLKDGQFLSHGIHLTSYDKTERQGKGVSALAYHRDDRSDSTPPGSSGGWPSRPPRSSDHHRRRRSSSATGKRSGTPRIVAAAPSTPRDTPERFNTIERSTWRHGSKDQNGSSRGTPIHRDSKDHSSFRSRSISRSPVPNGSNTYDSRRTGGSSIRTGDQASHHRSMTTLRSDLDDDRAGRLKRAMSFSTKSVGPLGAGGSRAGSVSRPETPSQPKTTGTGNGLGLLGSVKSLYATIRRGSKNGKENKTPTNDQTKFDNGIDKPQRPPRKHQSSSSVTSGNSGQFNSLDRRQPGKGSSRQSQPTSLSASQSDLGNKWSVYPPPQPQQQQHHYQQQSQHQQQQHHSRQVQHHSSSPVTRRETMPTRRDGTASLRRDTTSSLTRHDTSKHRNDNRQYQSTSSFVLSPGSVGSGGSGRHRSSSRSRLDEIDNRNAPRFEPERHRERSRNSRFFGQEDDYGLEDEVERERARPPPDMRRLLLSNVNSHRSSSKNLDVKPSVIRAM